MKGLFIFLATLLFATTGMSAPAAPNLLFSFMFCAAQTPHTGLHCSDIKFVYRGAYGLCSSWANQNNLPLQGVYYNRNIKKLSDKQEDICASLEGNKGKWQCLIIEDCGMTSSIGPIDKIVFSLTGDVEAARDKCVDKGWLSYKNALKAINHGCKIAPDAVEMMH